MTSPWRESAGMNAYFQSIDLLTDEKNFDNNVLDHLQKSFPLEIVTLADVTAIFQTLIDRMAKGISFLPRRHSPGYFVVQRFLVHLHHPINNHEAWLAELEPLLWRAYCACFANGASGFTVDLLQELLKYKLEESFKRVDRACQLLQAVQGARIEAGEGAGGGEGDSNDASYALNRLNSLAVSVMLEKFSGEILYGDAADLVQEFFLDCLTGCNSTSLQTASFKQSALSCLQRKLTKCRKRPVAASLVHFFSPDPDFVHAVVACLVRLSEKQQLTEWALNLTKATARNLGCALDELKQVDFRYLTDESFQLSERLLVSKGGHLAESAVHLIRQVYRLTSARRFNLADFPSVASALRNLDSGGPLCLQPDPADCGGEGPTAAARCEYRLQLFKNLLPAAAASVSDLIMCLPAYWHLLNKFNRQEFCDCFAAMYFEGENVKLVQAGAEEFQPALLSCLDKFTAHLVDSDEQLRLNPLADRSIEEFCILIDKLLRTLLRSPGKKMIHSRPVQLKLLSMLRLAASSHSLCLLRAVHRWPADLYNWAVVSDQFPDAVDILAEFLRRPDTSADSLHHGQLFASALLKFFNFIFEKSPEMICEQRGKLHSIGLICLDRGELTAVNNSGADVLTADGITLVSIFSRLMCASELVKLLPVNSELYPLYIRFIAETGQAPVINASSLSQGLVQCLGDSADTVAPMLVHIPQLLDYLGNVREADSNQQQYQTLVSGLLAALISCANSRVPDKLTGSLALRLASLTAGDSALELQLLSLVSAICRRNPRLAADAPEQLRDLLVDRLRSSVSAGDASSGAVAIAGIGNLVESLAGSGAAVGAECAQPLIKAAERSLDLLPAALDVAEKVAAEADPAGLMAAACRLTDGHLAAGASPERLLPCLALMRRCGARQPRLLAEREAELRAWRQRPALLDACERLLDVVADRSLAGLSVQLSGQAGQLGELSAQAGDAERRLNELDNRAGEAAAGLGEVRERLGAAEVRVDGLDEAVAAVDERLEEIDLKTLSTAPAWSREVSRLMNPERAADWRLLAQRLGFAAEDIRAWSTTPDPCLSLLAEFYANNRAAEATRAVLKQLQEIDRRDAAVIVEAAIRNAESAASDDPVEFTAPRTVFLSYQWAHQAQVRLLKQHLELAGYRCWMDIGEMGGGDKLFSAIDAGIRSAKVMVACITENYSKSDNCRRELSLAVSLGKQLIPIQLERVAWPPEGPMGPLLTEYLYIRMYSRGGRDGANSSVFWQSEKFAELLAQIRLSVAPDHALVAPDYADWWRPKEQRAGKVQKQEKEAEADEEKKHQEELSSPEVFLSYQWASQEQVKLLYAGLVAAGYTCWLDIYQMGGGDSLYDKIDRGVRGCRVLVACVTSKYAASPNCRREVSLADALKKPLLPVSLRTAPDEDDAVSGWPPEGPMSMAFAPLVPVRWCGDQDLRDILARLRQLAPQPATGRGGGATREARLKRVRNVANASQTCGLL